MVSLVTISSQVKTVQTRGKKVSSTANTTNSTPTVVKANVQQQVQQKSRNHLLPHQNISLKKTSVAVSKKKENRIK